MYLFFLLKLHLTIKPFPYASYLHPSHPSPIVSLSSDHWLILPLISESLLSVLTPQY